MSNYHSKAKTRNIAVKWRAKWKEQRHFKITWKDKRLGNEAWLTNQGILSSTWSIQGLREEIQIGGRRIPWVYQQILGVKW